MADGAAVDEVITCRNFRFEIDGKEHPLLSCEPGAFTMAVKDATMGSRKGNLKVFTGTKPEFGAWRIEKYYSQGDTALKDWFEQFARGQRKLDPQAAGSLIYLDRESNEARRINFFGPVPTSYHFIELDSRRTGAAATEVLEFTVARCEYQ